MSLNRLYIVLSCCGYMASNWTKWGIVYKGHLSFCWRYWNLSSHDTLCYHLFMFAHCFLFFDFHFFWCNENFLCILTTLRQCTWLIDSKFLNLVLLLFRLNYYRSFLFKLDLEQINLWLSLLVSCPPNIILLETC